MNVEGRRYGRLLLILGVAAALACVLLLQRPKVFNTFDQSFYYTIAYDLTRHGVFSNGIYDDVDSSTTRPPPGMRFGPVYPMLVALVMKLDPRFDRAVACAVESQFGHRDIATCEVYALPVLLLHVVLLTVGIVCVGLAAGVIFGGAVSFPATVLFASVLVVGEASILSYMMTESLAFCLATIAMYLLVLGIKTQEARHFIACGVATGVLTLARPSFAIWVGLLPFLMLLGAWTVATVARKRALLNVFVFGVAFALSLSPWLMRNQLVIGKLGVTEEYGAAVLIQRFAYNSMTTSEFWLAFPQCVPQVGRTAVKAVFGEDAVARFEGKPGNFFELGNDLLNAALLGSPRLDSIFPSLLRAEIRANGWWHLLVSAPLAWCGLWVGRTWSLLFIPVFGWALFAAARRKEALFLIYATPPLVMVAAHALLANGNTRYNLGLIGPVAIGAAWVLTAQVRRWRARLPQADRQPA